VPQERKVVTVLFADIVDSSATTRSYDAEVLRAALARMFARTREILVAHGATVEKVIGDAVMAVFGIPQTHEDDAIRAVRAGFAILESVRELELQARIGLESGEVVSDEADLTFATGEAINVAVRLQQEASRIEEITPDRVLVTPPPGGPTPIAQPDNPDPSEVEVRDVLSGNLCRCACYPNIVDAVAEAAGRR